VEDEGLIDMIDATDLEATLREFESAEGTDECDEDEEDEDGWQLIKAQL